MLSTVSISLLKRFKIRPMGVMSKKYAGVSMMLASIIEWSQRDAIIQPRERRSVDDKLPRAITRLGLNISSHEV